MKAIFAAPIMDLPKADIPIEGLTAYLSQSATHQTLYMQFKKEAILPEHAHSDQMGFVLEGQIDISINGDKHTFVKGDCYHIEAGVLHSAKVHAGYADITVFMEVSRYKERVK